jgi:hypothetical protein
MSWEGWRRGLQRRSRAVWFGGLAIAISTAAMAAGPAEGAGPEPDGGSGSDGDPPVSACGKPGQVPCPLQAWMRRRVAGPLASADWAELAKGLEESAGFAPDPSWTAWATYATTGAKAAREGEITAVRKTCKQCHDAYRKEYRQRYRSRPLPR